MHTMTVDDVEFFFFDRLYIQQSTTNIFARSLEKMICWTHSVNEKLGSDGFWYQKEGFLMELDFANEQR